MLSLRLELYAGYPGVLEKLLDRKLTRRQELAKSRRPHDWSKSRPAQLAIMHALIRLRMSPPKKRSIQRLGALDFDQW